MFAVVFINAVAVGFDNYGRGTDPKIFRLHKCRATQNNVNVNVFICRLELELYRRGGQTLKIFKAT
jgi:hypothetical protein